MIPQKTTAKQLANKLLEKFKTAPEHHTAGRLHVFSAKIAVGRSAEHKIASFGDHKGQLISLTTLFSLFQTYHKPEPKHLKHGIGRNDLELNCLRAVWHLDSDITLDADLEGHESMLSFINLVRSELDITYIEWLASIHRSHWLNKLRKEQIEKVKVTEGITVVYR